MTVDSRVPIALVGGGTIAPLHAKYLLLSGTCRLVALIDPFEPGQILASELGIPHFVSVAALLDSPVDRPEGYIVCVPSSLHVKVATEVISLASPKAVLVEKPISTDSKSAAELVKSADDASCKILVGHHRRSHPYLAVAKDAIKAGNLGQIVSISCLWVAKKNSGYFTVAPWRSSRSAGGGPVWTNLIHDIDMVHYLVGSHIVQIWSIPCTRHRNHHPDTPIDDLVEEGAVIMARFENGVVGTFHINDNGASPFNWESAAGDNPLYPKANPQVDCYRIFGTEGVLSGPDGVIWSYLPEQAKAAGVEVGWNAPISRKFLEPRDGAPFHYQTEHFSRVIRGLDDPICSGEDGVAATKVCEAVIQALTLGDGMPICI
ncbi:hypothetical protein AbraIFM66951_004202 [Aspergillus brasiliensis]|uniref:Gfo/Idh/MocA-like oxidoreductase N-terminal domain-containing protein n=1 Tax=Aspergillus brasiliensis TaxID=319629 RepID=A0A9W5Z4W2_9EURO|nr:hypothetical protein AbraCBS73388_005461 [Aspergillus brasiliensis]GKZ50835.1 hypothetical protein AbraIFM66951_004202 [Aspergillus brasiliensis]